MNPTLAALFSEGVLSLYPILIKSVPTNLFSQLLARFAVFPVLALIFGPLRDTTRIWSTPYEAVAATLNGALNLGHIGASYLSFSLLPAGTAISLFYLYPLFNLLAGALLFGESLSPLTVVVLLIAVAGVYLIVKHRTLPVSKESESPEEQERKTRWGIVMGLLAALTETMIFVFVRWNKDAERSPFYTVQHLYPAGLAALLYMAWKRPQAMDTSPTHWASLLGFNALLGFTGYLSRFYAIPKLPTIAFSLLSFMGVAFGYLWGILFTGDRPTMGSIAGGGLIAGAVAILRWFKPSALK